MPTADGQYHADEFIQEVIGIDRLRSFHIDMSGDTIVVAAAEFWKTHNDLRRRFAGTGKTMGFALASLRENIREHYGQ